MDLQKREDLRELREQALKRAYTIPDNSWRKAYKDIANAANVLDAFIARIEALETKNL